MRPWPGSIPLRAAAKLSVEPDGQAPSASIGRRDRLGTPADGARLERYGRKNRSLDSGRNDLIAQLQRNLFHLGYEPLPKAERGEFSQRTERVVERFQGRYMTGQKNKYLGDDQKYRGKANIHTIVMIQAVLAARGMEWRSVF